MSLKGGHSRECWGRGLNERLGLKLRLEAGYSEVLRNEEKPAYMEEASYQELLGTRAALRTDRQGTGRSIRTEQSVGCFGRKHFHHGLGDAVKLCWALLAPAE